MTDFTPPTAPPGIDDSPSAIGTAAPGLSAKRIGPDSSPGGSGGSRVWIFALVALAAAGAAAYFTGSGDQSTAAAGIQSSAEAAAAPAPESGVEERAGGDPESLETPAAEDPQPTEEADPEPSVVPGADEQTAIVVIDGVVLDQMPNTPGPTTPEMDPAIGQIAPTLTGYDFEGNQVTIGPDGRPKAIYFLAHWCPHCQVEMPTIQSLIDAGRQPANLDIYGVSSAVAPERGNYPPQDWFEAERWSSPVMLDNDDSSALINYGAGGFPFVVFLDGDHRVLTRAAGEMPAELMQQVWDAVAATS